MKQKLLLVVALLLSVCTGTWADDSESEAYVAKVTIDGKTTYYEQMHYAVKAAGEASAATITLLADVPSDDYYYQMNGDITLEGGDYTWTQNEWMTVLGKLTINSGTLYFPNELYEAVKLNAGTLVMNGGTIKCDACKKSAIYVEDYYNVMPHLIISGGTIKSNLDDIFVLIDDLSYISITGGTFAPGTNSTAIRHYTTTTKLNACLTKGYDFYLADGTATSADVNTLPEGEKITVKAAEFTPTTFFPTTACGNITYRAIRPDDAGQMSSAAAIGYVGDMPESTVITFPETVTDPYNSLNVLTVDSIADEAFCNQTNLTGVTLDNIKGVGNKAFSNTRITSLTIPESVEWLAQEAFGDIFTLFTINYNANVRNKEYTNSISPFADSDTNVNTLNIGKNVTSIPDYMFYTLGDDRSASTRVVTSNAVIAPVIGDKTFGSTTKATFTLETPNATDNSYVAWGFTNYSPSVTYLRLTDALPTLISGTYQAGNITYTRTGLTSGNYGSFAVPFDYDVADVTGIEKAYQPIGISIFDENNTLTVFFDEVTSVSAGTPVLAKINAETAILSNKVETTIISSSAGKENSNVVYKKTDDGAIVAKDESISVKFGGTFQKLTNTEKPGLQVFNYNGSFSPYSYVNPFRAYFTTNAWDSARSILINAIFDNDVTGVQMILSDDGTLAPVNGTVYDINGRQLASDTKSLPKGIYIINGKKVIK